jgi:general secretion pathway protein D
MKRLAVAFALSLLVAGPVVATPAAPAAPVSGLISGEVDIRLFIQQIARMTDMTFIVDPRVDGMVVATTEAPPAKDDLLDFFIDTLRASGVAAVPSVGGAYRIFPAEDSVQRTSAGLTRPAGVVRL